MSFKTFLKSKLFFRHLGYAIAIASGFLLISLLWLNIYTRHGQARPVPDFVGLPIEEVIKVAKKSKLNFTVIDSVYTDAVDKGMVAEQNPKPGFKVKKGRNVSLIVNAIRPEMVPVPDLIDLPLRQAVALLENAGLEVGALIYKPDISIDVVLGQQYDNREIEPNSTLEKGSRIDLILGKGLSDKRTSVPDLIGSRLERARGRIIGASLNVGTYIYDKTITNAEDSAKAFIYQQNPIYSENATVQLGSSIYLWLTTDSSKLPVDSTLVISAIEPIPPVDPSLLIDL